MAEIDIRDWPESIRQRYENYLKTSFFFKEPLLRAGIGGHRVACHLVNPEVGDPDS